MGDEINVGCKQSKNMRGRAVGGRKEEQMNEIQEEERAHIVILDHNYLYILVQGSYMFSKSKNTVCV